MQGKQENRDINWAHDMKLKIKVIAVDIHDKFTLCFPCVSYLKLYVFFCLFLHPDFSVFYVLTIGLDN